MNKRYLTGLLVATLVAASTGLALAHHPEGSQSHGWDDYDPMDGPRAGTQSKQHGSDEGHLPPTQHNVDLVGKVQLTEVEGGVADVGYYKGYAYLNAFNPECAGRPDAQGTGVHVVDVRDPSDPTKVGFLPAEPNSYVGEGIHVITFQGRDILVHNNETCDTAEFVTSGVAVWDVTDPLAPVKLGQYGDPDPAVGGQTFHTVHSTQAFVWQNRAYFVAQDNQDLKDVDIFDMTPLILTGAPPVLVSETGLEDWPGAQGSYANGDSVFHHDMQQKIIGGHNYLLASYWDAGQILLNIDDPSAPVFVGDSDFPGPDPQSGFEIPEGNSHESYWSSNSKYILSTDEDFSPNRTLFEITSGPDSGPYGAGEFGWTPSIDSLPDGTLNGPTVFGGQGCDGDPLAPSAGTISADPGEEKTVVYSRGACFFSEKVENGQDAGYDAVIIGQSHGGSRGGLLPDGFICGGQGHDFDEQARAICIGHRAMHLLFGDTPGYTGADGGDIPLGAEGERYTASTVFDGWGYVNLHDATDPDLPIIDTYAIPEAFDPAKAAGFGDLTVHEVKTDPRRGINLAYFSYYSGGFRVAEFGASGITEVGRFIDEGGNNFWGVFPVGAELAGHGYEGQHPGIGNGVRPLILASDRDYGLYIFDYTGKKPKKN